MSFSKILSHRWYACDGIYIQDLGDYVSITGADPGSFTRDEIFLPGLVVMDCFDYIITEGMLTKRIEESDTAGIYVKDHDAEKDIINVIPTINTTISNNSICPGALMDGHIEMGRGSDPRLRGRDVLFRVIYGNVVQAVMSADEIDITLDSYDEFRPLTVQRHLKMSTDELVILARSRAPKMDHPHDSCSDIDIVTCL